MENELIVRLVECAKPLQSTVDVVGWADTTSIPKKGEICLEYYTETTEGDEDYGKVCYKLKIGDGVNVYTDLPYFPTTKDTNSKIAAWVSAHLDVNDYAQASFNTTTKTLSISAIGETDGRIHNGTNFNLQFIEGEKIDIVVQSTDNNNSTITIEHELTTTNSSTGTKRDFGDSVITGITYDTTGHITNIETSALPDNPVAAGTVTADTTLVNNEVILGGGNSSIKPSGKTITTDAPSSASTNNTIPTSKAVNDAIDSKINDLDSSVSAEDDELVTGITQTNGTLTGVTTVSKIDVAPIQSLVEGTKIDISNDNSGNYTITHESTTTTTSTGTKREFEGNIITGITTDSTGHITDIETSALPSNPVNDLNSSVAADNNNVLTGITQTAGELTNKTQVSYTDIAPVQDVAGGNHITVSNSNNTFTVNHDSVGTGSAITPTSGTAPGWGGDVITGVNIDSYGHVASVTKGVLPANPVENLQGSGTATHSGITVQVDSTAGEVDNVDVTVDIPTLSSALGVTGAMIMRGTIGTGGTITVLPSASSDTLGDTYKVITEGVYGGISANVGDLLVCRRTESSSYEWILIPSGDETFTDTWRAIKINGVERLGNSINTSSLDIIDGTKTNISFNTTNNTLEINHDNVASHDSSIDTALPATATDRKYIKQIYRDPQGHVTGVETGDETTYTVSGSNGVNASIDGNSISVSGINATTSGVGVVQLQDSIDTTNNKAATPNAVKNAIDNSIANLDVNTDKGGASINNDVITITSVQQEDGLIKNGNSISVNLDGNYNSTTNKIATQSTVNTKIESLDVTGYTQATAENNTLTINGIKEVDGIISKDTTKNVTINYTDIAPIQNVTTTDTGDTGLEVSISNNNADVHHKTITSQSETVIHTDDTEVIEKVVTNVNTDDYGHVIGTTVSNSDKLIAADIKNPDKWTNNNSWYNRQTNEGVGTGKDVAKLNPLKGNTIVWNQLVENGNFVNGTTGWSVSSGTLSVNNNTLIWNNASSALFQSKSFITTHKYYISAFVKCQYAFNFGAGGSSTTREFPNSPSSFNRASNIVSPTVENNTIFFYPKDNTEMQFRSVIMIDLTKMFGSDAQIAAALGVTVAEITTDKAVEAFEKLFPLPYYNYNEGELISLGGNTQIDPSLYVDMGLPSGTLWAKTDIDVTQPNGFATSPYTYSKSFFSWGNVEGHNPNTSSTFDYNWGGVNANAPYYEGQVYGNTKGNTLTGGIPVGKEFDAARANLGSPWRMPLNTEFQELIDNCIYIDADGVEVASNKTDKRVTVNGVLGLYLQSKTNGNRLFFACSGNGGGFSWGLRGSLGFYWTASFNSVRNARNLFFNSDNVNPQDSSTRYYGIPVRPVLSQNPSFAIKSTGFNQWDEEWRVGYYSDANGAFIPGGTNIANINPIRVIPSSKFYFYKKDTPRGHVIFYYDSNMGFVGTSEALTTNHEFTIPANVYYINFYIWSVNSYNHDICINISDPSRNGTYEPYKKYTLDLDWIKTLRINNELLFPNGLCSAGSVYDEVGEDYAIKRVGAVDLGDFNYKVMDYSTSGYAWANTTNPDIAAPTSSGYLSVGCACSKYPSSLKASDGYMNDKTIAVKNWTNGAGAINIKDSSMSGYTTAQVKAALKGVMLYYELATPIIIKFNKKSLYYVVDDSGTEQLLPVNDSDPITAPINGNIEYHSNIKEVVKDILNTSSGDTYSLSSNNATTTSYNDASVTLTDSNGNKQSITIPYSVIRNDDNVTIILNGNFQ